MNENWYQVLLFALLSLAWSRIAGLLKTLRRPNTAEVVVATLWAVSAIVMAIRLAVFG